MGMGTTPGEDFMTIILGLEPDEPGMHGPLKEPCPSSDAVGLVTKIRDMCDEWLRSAGKEECSVEGDDDSDAATEVGETEEE